MSQPIVEEGATKSKEILVRTQAYSVMYGNAAHPCRLSFADGDMYGVFVEQEVAAHLKKAGLVPEAYAQKWFVGLCVHTMPFTPLIELFEAFRMFPPLCIALYCIVPPRVHTPNSLCASAPP
jgi:hypothetical protein